MIYQAAGGRGPVWAWRLAYTRPTDAPTVDLTQPTVATVVVHRPDGTSTTWQTSDGSLTLVSPTTTTVTLQHVLATDGSDLPFQQVDQNDLLCEYKFVVEIYVAGAFVERFAKCLKLRNPESCQ